MEAQELDMLFERNERYSGRAAADEAPALRDHPEAAAWIAALRSGQVGLIEAVPPLDAGVLEREPTLRVVSSVQKLACRRLPQRRAPRTRTSPWATTVLRRRRVRMALNLAVNREAIVQKIFHGLAIVNASPVRDRRLRLRGARRRIPFDPARRETLLAEATGKDGDRRAWSPLLPTKHYGQAFDETVAGGGRDAEATWACRSTVKPLDFGTLLQTLTKGTLPPNGGFCRVPHRSNNLDADDFVRDWATTTLVNWTPYPPELDGALRGHAPAGRSAEALRLARRPAAPGARLGAGGVALPGGEGLRPQHARAAVSRRRRS